MKGQFLVVSSIVIGIILLTTATAIFQSQEPPERPELAQDVHWAKLHAEEIGLDSQQDRRTFSALLNRKGISHKIERWGSRSCYNLTLSSSHSSYEIQCIDK